MKNASEATAKPETKNSSRKQVSIQELVESLKGVAEDIGQISELTGEERLLVSQFFVSLFKLMQPLTTDMPVSVFALPDNEGSVSDAHIYPNGYLLDRQDHKACAGPARSVFR